MKRIFVIPIILGFLAIELYRWLAEEDTIEGHVANIIKGVKDHVDVMEKILIDKSKGELE